MSCPPLPDEPCAPWPVGVDSGGFGSQLSALVGLLGGVYHLSHCKVQGLLGQALGIVISTGADQQHPLPAQRGSGPGGGRGRRRDSLRTGGSYG